MTWFLVIAFFIIFGVNVLLFFYGKKRRKTSPTGHEVAADESCATCTGASAMCEQECMMKAATEPIEYFDDEELDRFSGRESDSYSDEEAEEFAEVLHTMRQNEVADWCRSLTLRGINLPNQIKDEVFLLIEN